MFYIFPKVFKIPKVYFNRSWVDKFHFFPSMYTSLFILEGEKAAPTATKKKKNFHTAQLNPNVVFKTYYIFVPVGGLSVCELEEFI